MPIQIYTRTKFEGLRRMNLHYMLTRAGQSPSPCRWKDNSINSPKKILYKRLPLFYILQRVNIDQIILEETEDNEAQVQTDDT